MSHPVTRRLATAPLTRSDGIAIELHNVAGRPAQILIRWPAGPTVVSPSPVALSDVARRVVKAFGDAQSELARLGKGES